MRLLRFETIDRLNHYLVSAKNVKKVKVLTEGNLFKLKTIFYVLVDSEGEYQK